MTDELSFDYKIDTNNGREVHQLWVKEFADLNHPIVGDSKETLILNAKMMFKLFQRFEIFTKEDLERYYQDFENEINKS